MQGCSRAQRSPTKAFIPDRIGLYKNRYYDLYQRFHAFDSRAFKIFELHGSSNPLQLGEAQLLQADDHLGCSRAQRGPTRAEA